MQDYEKMFATKVYEMVRTKVKGRVTVYVKDDVLHVKNLNGDFCYEKTFENFAGSFMNGLTSQYVAYAFSKDYSKYLRRKFFY